MTQQLLLLVVGFVLTSVAGGALGSWFQRRAWAHQHEIQLRDEERQREVQRRDEEHQRALKTFEEVSQLLDRRLYRMRRLYWAAREMAAGPGDLRGWPPPGLTTGRSWPSGTTTSTAISPSSRRTSGRLSGTS